ncbi:histidine kinase [Streptomyces armeniacus]|uniref:histidine kinase n=1 Tax=Streptomyces armeniacus TaxID=83291 RepID=A0A345XKU1_9ACTN|nr:histidine kinase [Streptomyces armeniacus]AXK32257.1 histidine kinase [Streptomyces armeniacus]
MRVTARTESTGAGPGTGADPGTGAGPSGVRGLRGVRRVRAHRAPLTDAAVALVVTGFTVWSDRSAGAVSFAYTAEPLPLWLTVPLGLLLGAVAWWRRRAPALFLAAALVAYVLVPAYVVVMCAQYTLAERTTSWRTAALGTAGSVLVVGYPIWRYGGADAVGPLTLAICVAPALFGLYIGTRRELVGRMRERAERAEREQRQRIQQARSDERAQIARDMHDVVTHRVSLMVLHATALEAAHGQDATTISRRIGTIGREALGELRSLVEVLRADGDTEAPLVPQPGLADLDELVASSRRLGVPVTLERTGGPGAVPSALVEHAVYRVVQEALTNVHKHADGAQTRVEVRHTPRMLCLTVANGPGRHGLGPGLPSGRYGLLGVVERIRLVGGELTAEPTADGGFEVRAEVPLPARDPVPEEVR